MSLLTCKLVHSEKGRTGRGTKSSKRRQRDKNIGIFSIFKQGLRCACKVTWLRRKWDKRRQCDSEDIAKTEWGPGCMDEKRTKTR